MKVTFPRYRGIEGERQKERGGEYLGLQLSLGVCRGLAPGLSADTLCGCLNPFYKMGQCCGPSGFVNAEGQLCFYYTYL